MLYQKSNSWKHKYNDRTFPWEFWKNLVSTYSTFCIGKTITGRNIQSLIICLTSHEAKTVFTDCSLICDWTIFCFITNIVARRTKKRFLCYCNTKRILIWLEVTRLEILNKLSFIVCLHFFNLTRTVSIQAISG